ILEFTFVFYRKELVSRLQACLYESVNRLRRDEDDGRHLAFAHLLQRDLMRNEGLFYVDAESAEDQRPRICRSRALGVEIFLLAREVLQALDLGPDKDVQLRREQIEQVRDAAPDLRYLNLVLFER